MCSRSVREKGVNAGLVEDRANNREAHVDAAANEQLCRRPAPKLNLIRGSGVRRDEISASGVEFLFHR